MKVHDPPSSVQPSPSFLPSVAEGAQLQVTKPEIPLSRPIWRVFLGLSRHCGALKSLLRHSSLASLLFPHLPSREGRGPLNNKKEIMRHSTTQWTNCVFLSYVVLQKHTIHHRVNPLWIPGRTCKRPALTTD